MYIQKIILQGILDLLRKQVDADLESLLEKVNPEIWVPRLTDDREHLIRPFNIRWWGEFTRSVKDCVQRIKEILAVRTGRELRSLISPKMSLSKQELLEIAAMLKIRMPKGANQWDIFGKIAAKIIKEQRKTVKKMGSDEPFFIRANQKSPFRLLTKLLNFLYYLNREATKGTIIIIIVMIVIIIKNALLILFSFSFINNNREKSGRSAT